MLPHQQELLSYLAPVFGLRARITANTTTKIRKEHHRRPMSIHFSTCPRRFESRSYDKARRTNSGDDLRYARRLSLSVPMERSNAGLYLLDGTRHYGRLSRSLFEERLQVVRTGMSVLAKLSLLRTKPTRSQSKGTPQSNDTAREETTSSQSDRYCSSAEHYSTDGNPFSFESPIGTGSQGSPPQRETNSNS